MVFHVGIRKVKLIVCVCNINYLSMVLSTDIEVWKKYTPETAISKICV